MERGSEERDNAMMGDSIHEGVGESSGGGGVREGRWE